MLFAGKGAVVHIIEVNTEAAAATVAEISAAGGLAFSYACDVSNQQSVIALFSSIGLIDILVNNAGIAHVGNVETTGSEDFDRVMNVNVKGTYNCLQCADTHYEGP